MKNKYVKSFFLRGLLFSGGGPFIAGIVYLCIELSGTHLALSGWDAFLAITSSIVLAFVQAGTSVFHKIESWGKAKAMLLQLACIYVVYMIVYLINRWIPFDLTFILIFSGSFIGAYIIVWLSIYFSIKAVTNRMNKKLIEKRKQQIE